MVKAAEVPAHCLKRGLGEGFSVLAVIYEDGLESSNSRAADTVCLSMHESRMPASLRSAGCCLGPLGESCDWQSRSVNEQKNALLDWSLGSRILALPAKVSKVALLDNSGGHLSTHSYTDVRYAQDICLCRVMIEQGTKFARDLNYEMAVVYYERALELNSQCVEDAPNACMIGQHHSTDFVLSCDIGTLLGKSNFNRGWTPWDEICQLTLSNSLQ